MNENSNFFIDTLNLILIPQKDLNVFFSDSILQSMEDLEGDSVSFLHEDYYRNVIKTNKEIDSDIALIRKSISEMEKEFWNVEDFLFHPKWVSLRNLTIKLILSLENLENHE